MVALPPASAAGAFLDEGEAGPPEQRVRRIVHVDMDAFYAAVHQRDDPSLRGRPVIVGGRKGRGVVCAASYEARRFGVHSAMPGVVAARLCPQGVFLKPDFARYKAVSEKLFGIFRDVSEAVQGISLDEAFLDVTDNPLGLETGQEVAVLVRRRIREELGLTASAGVAPTKLVAKIASDYRKPDGLTVVAPSRVVGFLRPLPVRRLWGVGPRTAERLEAVGLHRIADIQDRGLESLVASLGDRGAWLWRAAHGIDPSRVGPRSSRRSRSAERTFARDVFNVGALIRVLDGQARRICGGLEKSETTARTVVLKIRYAPFETHTRSRSLRLPTADVPTILRAAVELLESTAAGRRPVRLIGLGVSGLAAAGAQPRQLELPFRQAG